VRHFFLTYKDLDGAAKNVEITHVYGKEEAYEVIKLASDDYTNKFGDVNEALAEALLGSVKI
jgi:inorganic pyrophosphatase